MKVALRKGMAMSEYVERFLNRKPFMLAEMVADVVKEFRSLDSDMDDLAKHCRQVRGKLSLAEEYRIKIAQSECVCDICEEFAGFDLSVADPYYRIYKYLGIEDH